MFYKVILVTYEVLDGVLTVILFGGSEVFVHLSVKVAEVFLVIKGRPLLLEPHAFISKRRFVNQKPWPTYCFSM